MEFEGGWKVDEENNEEGGRINLRSRELLPTCQSEH